MVAVRKVAAMEGIFSARSAGHCNQVEAMLGKRVELDTVFERERDVAAMARELPVERKFSNT